MKKNTKVISFILSIITMLAVFPIGNVIYATEGTQNYYIPEMDENFCDNTIMVVFNNEASLSLKNYEKEDFDEIQCESVIDLSTATANSIKIAQENITRHVIYGEPLNSYNGIAFDEYKQVVCLKLQNKGKENVINAIKSLKSRGDIFYVGPDYYLDYDSVITSVDSFIDDPYVSSIWSLDNINAEEAWEITYGSSTVNVAIIDSGIDADHNDLSDNINVDLSRDCLPYPTKPQEVTDASGHGTMVAGIIGAVGGNAIGSSGVCPEVSLVSLKVEDSEGASKSSYVASAINYATEKNIPIINMSISWSSAKNNMSSYDVSLEQCIRQYPGIFICSAGNKNISNDIYLRQYRTKRSSCQKSKKVV